MRRALGAAAWLLASSLAAAQITPPSDTDVLLDALNRNLKFVVRGDASLTVLFPPRAVPVRRAASLPPIKVFARLLRQNFAVKQGTAETVAGRPTRIYVLTPKVGAAASWRIWVDTSWNVPLAYEERGADGTLARRAELLRADKLQKRAQPLKADSLAGLGQALRLALPGLVLPPGFEPVGVGQRKAGGQPKLSLNLSDGVNVLALVLAQKNVKAAQGVASRQVGTGFVWLVGNLAVPDLQAALRSVRPGDSSALGTFAPPGDSNP